MSKVLIIGKMFEKSKNNGSSGVIRCLKDEFIKLNLDVDFILLNENVNKLKFLVDIFLRIVNSNKLIIQVHTDGYLIPLYILILSLLNKKNEYYLVVHGIYRIQSLYDSSSSNKIKYYIYKNIENIVYRNFKNIICISEMLRKDIELYFGRTNNITVINNGVELLNNYNIYDNNLTNGKIKLIYVGGINELKGINECVEIVNKLVYEYNLDVYIDIYGSNNNINLYKKIMNKIKRYDLSERIKVRCTINDRKELYKQYSNSHFNLCLSKYDTFNNAVLESMSCGCVPIVSNMCGVSYILENNKDSIIVKLNNNMVDETCNIINEYVKSIEKYNKIKNEAISKAYKHGWKNSAIKYYNIREAKNG